MTTKKISLRITKKHIESGSSAASDCPIALALLARRYRDVQVGDNQIDMKGWTCFPSPKKARNFIDRFDASKPVKPTTLSLTFKSVE